MIAGEEHISDYIDSLIGQDRTFAIYRIPGEQTPRMVMQASGSASFLYAIESLNGKNGYVIAPFHISERYPIVLIRPDEEICLEKLPAGKRQTVAGDIPGQLTGGQDAYTKRFRQFLRPLDERQLDKLVLSRTVTLRKEKDFSPATAFLAACRRYIRSYVYLCHTPQTGTWLGSTPEILLSGAQGTWQTVALAGTQKIRNEQLPGHWNRKNRQEQEMVAHYIEQRLLSAGLTPERSAPYTVRAGELAHLKTEFTFHLPDTGRLGTILQLLHPTPAVCGLPKEMAYNFILEHEGYERKYYSGFIGRLNPGGSSELYVNLRCMEILPEELVLYAGGGLLASSSLEEEWQETEDKLQTMLMLTR
ncbi:MAG: isochorismate synthase [Tannerellaceae bacterium]|nr:isochorismate synthase [Tannerellaceae bacterium]